jgi:hypothetical protein
MYACVEYRGHPLFPADAPRGQAHILEDSMAYDEEGPRQMPKPDYELCNFIATFLYNLEEYPNALKDFFNPEVKSFRLIRDYGNRLIPYDDDDEFYGILPFIIWRRGNNVFVSPRLLLCSITPG